MTIFYLLCNENTISDQMHNFPPLKRKRGSVARKSVARELFDEIVDDTRQRITLANFVFII